MLPASAPHQGSNIEGLVSPLLLLQGLPREDVPLIKVLGAIYLPGSGGRQRARQRKVGQGDRNDEACDACLAWQHWPHQALASLCPGRRPPHLHQQVKQLVRIVLDEDEHVCRRKALIAPLLQQPNLL